MSSFHKNTGFSNNSLNFTGGSLSSACLPKRAKTLQRFCDPKGPSNQKMSSDFSVPSSFIRSGPLGINSEEKGKNTDSRSIGEPYEKTSASVIKKPEKAVDFDGTIGTSNLGTLKRSVLPAASKEKSLPFGSAPTGRQSPGKEKEDFGKQEVVSITYEEIGLFPRSFSRVLDRFFKQVFSDVENLVIQEYRFYRYLFLTTVKCVFILIFVPVFVNFLAKTYIVRPLTEYFWNTKQTEIFLNYYQQKRAFAELKDFEEKIYFESLIYPKSTFSFPSQSNMHRFPGLPPKGPFKEQVETDLSSSNRDSLLHSSELSNLGNRLALNKNSGPERTEGTEGRHGFVPFSSGTTSNYPGEPIGLLTRPSLMKETKVDVGIVSLLSKEKDQTFLGQKRDFLASVPSDSQKQPGFAELEPTNLLLPYKENRSSSLMEREEANEGKTGELQTDSLIHSYTLKSSLFVYQTREADKNIQQRYQEKCDKAYVLCVCLV